MQPALLTLVAAACLSPGVKEGPSAGYLLPADGNPVEAPAYEPREGDLIFFDDHSPMWTVLFAHAGTGPPLHVGIVVKRYNGSLAVLEAGPDDSVVVTLQAVAPRLRQFHRDFQGTITIRRCKRELSPARSKALTYFAEAQEGKQYAVLRMLLQGTPFRCRGPVRERFLAHTYLDRWSWFCSELVVAAGTVAGLFPDKVKANVTYPLDLVNNRRHDLGATWEDAETWRLSRKPPVPSIPFPYSLFFGRDRREGEPFRDLFPGQAR
jgi:hypothetical protein